MDKSKVPLVSNPGIDLGEALAQVMGDTGGVHEMMGGFRIKVYHLRAFPWADVFKMLVFRDFRVYVTRHKADIFIEASV